jgi:hypothetical protein
VGGEAGLEKRFGTLRPLVLSPYPHPRPPHSLPIPSCLERSNRSAIHTHPETCSREPPLPLIVTNPCFEKLTRRHRKLRTSDHVRDKSASDPRFPLLAIEEGPRCVLPAGGGPTGGRTTLWCRMGCTVDRSVSVGDG